MDHPTLSRPARAAHENPLADLERTEDALGIVRADAPRWELDEEMLITSALDEAARVGRDLPRHAARNRIGGIVWALRLCGVDVAVLDLVLASEGARS